LSCGTKLSSFPNNNIGLLIDSVVVVVVIVVIDSGIHFGIGM